MADLSDFPRHLRYRQLPGVRDLLDEATLSPRVLVEACSEEDMVLRLRPVLFCIFMSQVFNLIARRMGSLRGSTLFSF